MDTTRASIRADALVAVVLAALLGAAWAAHGWANLARLHLPDTDDVARLQQVRDWLAGQNWADLTQHRLGTGVPMHWSRLADLGPALGITLLRPLLGLHAAELASVGTWPLILFAAALFLVARIGRQLGSDLAGTAAVLAAISYPATTLFLPGRIDHHGLQMVFLLGALLAALRPPSAGSGFTVGMLAAASLIVGLETVPLLGVLGAVLVLGWVLGDDPGAERMLGLGIGALTALAIGRGLFATTGWNYPACDGFTGEAWRAALPLAAVPLLSASLSRFVAGRRGRAGLAIGITVLASAVALWLSPGCASPYGRLDPALTRVWLSGVEEAQPLFAASFGTGLGYAGLAIAGVVAGLWHWHVERRAGWAILVALQLTSLAVTCVQLRGAYAAALLAAPALAAVVRAARARGALPLVGAWLASAGMLYPLAAEALTTARHSGAREAGCGGQALLDRLATLAPGTVAAPVDLGAYGLAATPHRFLAAPYHRDGAGILAAHDLFAGSPAQAARIADRWHVDYVVTCPGQLPGGPMPGWRRIATAGHATIWAKDRLSAGHAPL